ncbi:MAG: putative DNA binding domain-containing protein [Anaerolineales bacterium]|nr:putative DNA binding domain-containing protein [Anaerolineales bacterium]
MDLHLHTPASSDYQQPEITYLDLLKRAEARGLDAIAFTDHNTVAGYRQMQEEVQQLELLEKLNRLIPEERTRLNEYRRLLTKILVLPGFEFTATFGFHILGLFSPLKPVREIEHLLLNLKIAPDQLDEGSSTVGATSDVLTAYRIINEAGGLVIAAHANSTNGVAMLGLNFGGQTKIAYTQDPNLHALEVTDLGQHGRHTTTNFFSGTKPEYPRRMHCIQGSDAHRLTADPQRKKNLGVGDRPTEVLLPKLTFDALKELFFSNDFARTRPRRQVTEPVFDFIRAAREEGPNIVQDFHETMSARGGKLYDIIADVCAFANTNGGTLYIGFSADPRRPAPGISKPQQAREQLEKEISARISPALQCTVDIQTYAEKKLLRVLVPRGDDAPYAVDESKIYVRSEAETGLAVRDEIVDLVMRHARLSAEEPQPEPPAPLVSQDPQPETGEVTLTEPRTGVEVVGVEERNGTKYYTLRDMRNGNIVKNVTTKSARRLWHYAITTYHRLPDDITQTEIHWQGGIGLLRHQKQGRIDRYDLVQRQPDGNYRVFFGVTEDGILDEWKPLFEENSPEE